VRAQNANNSIASSPEKAFRFPKVTLRADQTLI
jgi:hypothetical protein